MTKDKALLMALEAMESVTVECNNFHHPKKDQNHHWAKCPPIVRWDKAITAIKEALAQPEQEPVAWVWVNNKGWLNYGETPHDMFKSSPLYPHPQRTWVGLNKEEAFELQVKHKGNPFSLSAAVENLLREKNT